MPKKKGRKRATITEEERLLVVQQKLQAEQELRKKKEDMLAQFLKEKLAKEERNSVLNLHKINLQWRTALRDIKAKELRKDILILSQTFERVVDCKESVVKSLAKDLAEAESQHAHALRSHLENLEKLLQLQEYRISSLEDLYDNEQYELEEEFEGERNIIMEQHEQECHYLQDVLLGLEQNFADSEYEARLDFQSTRDDIKNKNLEEKHYLRMQLEGKVEELWKRFQQALRNYTEATEDRKIAFEVLKQKDEKSTKEIDMQMKKLQTIQDLILLLKNKLAVHFRESEDQNRHIREEKEVMLKQLQRLKCRMIRARAEARSNLAKLAMESNGALKRMQHVVEKADVILRLAEMCRRLESEEEKLLPFYMSSLSWDDQKVVDKMIMEKPVESLAKVMKSYAGLDRFWQRYNKVRLEQLSLKRTKVALMQENVKLRHLLKKYLDGISVNDEVMSHINPLIIVNQHGFGPPLPQPVPVSEGRVKRPVYNVVEAAHKARDIL